MKIKKNDVVKIITGKYKGQQGRVIKVIKEKNRVVVEGVNSVKKHTRPTQDNPQGGIVEKEASIHRSNVVVLRNNKPTKISYKVLESGKKVRYSNKLKGNID